VEQVLPMLDTASGSAQLRFLLSPDPELEGRPADHLCCDRPTGLELIARRAGQFGQHLAR
jgi:hypothetical protein